ncbi:hypothetical protein F5X99DRAFT_423685 [Biscogniauxia marginata]|nr:hypothetical protein F5X99DRAFT_423685 [Biscogniauxia marginata]
MSQKLVILLATVSILIIQSIATLTVVEPGTSDVDCDPYLQIQAQADEYSSDNVMQQYVYTEACSSSLRSYISSVGSNCGDQPLPWEGMTHSYFGKVLQTTYNMTCLKDPVTGDYCTQVLLSFGSTTAAELSLEEACSPCMLAVSQQIQATSYSNYDENLAEQWVDLQARCGVSYPTEIQPAETNGTGDFGYADNYTIASSCWSGSTYTVIGGDDCNIIAAAQGVLCMPERCDTYTVQPDDTCYGISAAHGITFTQLLSYNPSLNPTCTNLISGTTVCIKLPGGEAYNATTITGATSTQTGSYATATVTPPASGVAFGTTPNCGKYYQVQSGDYCQIVALKNSIDLALFRAINPSIDESCDNLVPGLWYCVWPTQNWNLTAPTSTFYTTVSPPAPMDTGASGACYVWYVVQEGDTCYKIIASYGITMDAFLAWNTGVNSECTNIIAGDA